MSEKEHAYSLVKQLREWLRESGALEKTQVLPRDVGEVIQLVQHEPILGLLIQTYIYAEASSELPEAFPLDKIVNNYIEWRKTVDKAIRTDIMEETGDISKSDDETERLRTANRLRKARHTIFSHRIDEAPLGIFISGPSTSNRHVPGCLIMPFLRATRTIPDRDFVFEEGSENRNLLQILHANKWETKFILTEIEGTEVEVTRLVKRLPHNASLAIVVELSQKDLEHTVKGEKHPSFNDDIHGATGIKLNISPILLARPLPYDMKKK